MNRKKLVVICISLVLGIFLIVWLVQSRTDKSTAQPLQKPKSYAQNPPQGAQVFLPLTVDMQAVNRLALLNFEQDPDDIYYGLELMYLDSPQLGQGYRVQAYRHDGYVDIYDDEDLVFDSDHEESIAGKGCIHHLHVDLSPVSLAQTDQGMKIQFSFEDYQGRPIRVDIQENKKDTSPGSDILAPVGASSDQPAYFPLFQLYHFNFLLKHQTDSLISIDGHHHEMDPFPVPFPLDGHQRNFGRYSLQTQLIELFPNIDQAPLISLDSKLTHTDGPVTYYFDDALALKEIFIDLDSASRIQFEPALAFKTQEGEIRIDSDPQLGPVAGHYSTQSRGDDYQLQLTFDQGWQAHKPSLMHRIMFNKNSVFSSWPKSYHYKLRMDMDSGQLQAEWINHN